MTQKYSLCVYMFLTYVQQFDEVSINFKYKTLFTIQEVYCWSILGAFHFCFVSYEYTFDSLCFWVVKLLHIGTYLLGFCQVRFLKVLPLF